MRMDEKLRTAAKNAKLTALFSQCLSETGYDEPEYADVQRTADKEFPFVYFRTFYDEQGLKRKEYQENSSENVEVIMAYDENGRCRGWMTAGFSARDKCICVEFDTRKFRMSLEDLEIQEVTNPTH